MKQNKFLDYPQLIRQEPLSEEKRTLSENAMQQVSELRKRYNVKIDLLESPHNSDDFSDELSEEELEVVVKELKMQTL